MRAKPTKGKTKKPGKKARASPHDGIDVSTEKDIASLEELISSQPIVLVFIYADWCGHCHTYKPQWENYKAIPGRRVPMASINEKVLSQTPLKSVKLDGYPSNVLYSGLDGSFGSFTKENGEETHAIPNTRDAALMKKLLITDPSMLKYMGKETRRGQKNDIDSESLQRTPEAELLLEESGKNAVKDKDRPIADMDEPTPPNTSSDTMQNMRRGGGVNQGGGSLLDSIMRYVGELVPTPPTRRRKRSKTTTRKTR
jgi:thiol-disulfide isomerase/thioredoxin